MDQFTADERRWIKDREAKGLAIPTAPSLQSFCAEVGRTYYQLTVVGYAGIHVTEGKRASDTIWRCRCACPTQTELTVRQSFLRNGTVKSCGRCTLGTPRQWPEQLLRKLALSFELEGAIGIYNVPKLVIGVRSYSIELLQRLKAETSVGAITEYTNSYGRVAQWQIAGVEAKLLARHVAPFSICKHEQWRLVEKFPIGDRGQRVSVEMADERDDLRAASRELNKRGPEASSADDWKDRAASWKGWIASAPIESRMELLAWAIEWEGHMGIGERVCEGGARGVAHALQFGACQSTHRETLLEVIRCLAGNIGNITRRTQKRSREAPMSVWRLDSEAVVKKLASELILALVAKRELAQLILEYPTWGRAPLPIPDDIFQKRRALAKESKRINACIGDERASR